MVSVKKGDITTRINKRSLDNYIKAGWEVVNKKTASPTPYDNYTKKQLISIGETRGLRMSMGLTKQEMIEQLTITEGVIKEKPKASNEGFTDGLIIEG